MYKSFCDAPTVSYWSHLIFDHGRITLIVKKKLFRWLHHTLSFGTVITTISPIWVKLLQQYCLVATIIVSMNAPVLSLCQQCISILINTLHVRLHNLITEFNFRLDERNFMDY